MFLKFIYSEKAAKFCKISTLLLTVCSTEVKNKVEISQNFVAFLKYLNFIDVHKVSSVSAQKNEMPKLGSQPSQAGSAREISARTHH